jgi:hypothetical protein
MFNFQGTVPIFVGFPNWQDAIGSRNRLLLLLPFLSGPTCMVLRFDVESQFTEIKMQIGVL